MTSLGRNFDEVVSRIESGRGISNCGDDPVYYLVFRPSQMIEVKRRLKEWSAKLDLRGWEVAIFSMADAVHEILRNHPMWEVWLQAEREDPFDFELINETLEDALTAEGGLRRKLEERLQDLGRKEKETGKKQVLLITDLEALHPYLRVGTLEGKLQGRFAVPTVVLYPGRRVGRMLKFLGIYPEDGNYRSNHIGG